MLGFDPSAVIAAFGGALLFSFMAKDTAIGARVVGLIGSWIFGYYVAQEVIGTEILGYELKTTPLPAFVSAFFCVLLFKLLVSIWEKDGRAWLRKKLGLSSEGEPSG